MMKFVVRAQGQQCSDTHTVREENLKMKKRFQRTDGQRYPWSFYLRIRLFAFETLFKKS
jgi:hypothetical protein